jgi:hypothetical protein
MRPSFAISLRFVRDFRAGYRSRLEGEMEAGISGGRLGTESRNDHSAAELQPLGTPRSGIGVWACRRLLFGNALIAKRSDPLCLPWALRTEST